MADYLTISEDFARLKVESGWSREVFTIAWGDRVEFVERDGDRTRLRVLDRAEQDVVGTVKGRPTLVPNDVLRFSVVDVQQGDAMLLETPQGSVTLIDGGDNQLFARHLAARLRGTDPADRLAGTDKDHPRPVDAIVVTHGDADHFQGLNQIRTSERHETERKRLFVHPQRVVHNGLLKGASKLKPEAIFGKTVDARSGPVVVDLADSITEAPAGRLNVPFKSWATTIRHWAKRGPIRQERVASGDRRIFDYLRHDGVEVEVLGPVTVTAKDGTKRRKGLPLLHSPARSAVLHEEDDADIAQRALSASHTINGHSVVLRLTYGNVRFFLGGDLNQEAMAKLRDRATPSELQAEILKVPHHGSADFDLRMLGDVAPVVSIISSGDESSFKEFIHPRATLVGALGRVARGSTSVVLCTELAAFFEYRGLSWLDKSLVESPADKRPFEGFSRRSFGLVQIRTDGERVLVFTHSGKENVHEAYRFTVDEKHKIRFADDVTTR
jgi:beta-lactamase superfamily II metal-dependent hydrolase